MRFLRTLSTPRLVALIAGFLAAAIGCTAIALATTSGGPTPPPKPLAVAVHDALSAPPVQGLSARIRFTNHLVGGSALPGVNPLVKGASGRLWLSSHRLRIELQGDNGDSQILVNGQNVTVYDSNSNTVYRGQLPNKTGHAGAKQAPPTLSRIQRALAQLADKAAVSGADPSNVAGQPAYTVRVTPKDGGGLLGGAALAWDATRGVPLRFAIYARGNGSPVLELTVTGISYGAVPASVFDISPPPNAKTVDVTPPANGKGRGGKDEKPVTGAAAVSKALPFKLSAPASLAGRDRSEVKLLHWGDSPAALVTYGQGLGTIVVVERATPARGPSGPSGLPSVDINGVKGQELDTALGTIVHFERGNVTFTVAGSVQPAAAKSAARGL